MKILKFVFILLLLITIPNVSASAQDNPGYPTYIIQPGDSLGYIAQIFDTSINEILSVNNFSDPDVISPGQSINIPGFDGLRGNLTILTIGLGENFNDLQIKYQLDPEQLVRINKITSPTQLYVGSKVIVALLSDMHPLVPVKMITKNITVLEAASLLNKNPLTLLLKNNQLNSFSFLNNSVVYESPDENLPGVSQFAPVLSEVSISPLPLVQGSTEVIHVSSENPVALSGFLNGYPLNFFSSGDGDYYALQGIHAMALPGLADFEITGTLEDGKNFDYSQKILLTPGVFDQDPPLIVDPKTIDPTITKPEIDLVTGLVSTITPTKYWTGTFQSPAVYQYYNSLFGTRRTYNDDPTVTFHAGVDFGGGITLPIYAPADGKVIFAGPLTVRGNTVFIDHGWGVFSGFFHQNKLSVKDGDMVTQGQVIGEVGNTGRVNGSDGYYGAGAHLHWEVWVNGVQVDPLPWLSNQYP